MRRRFQSRRVKLLAAFVVALCLAGGAFAYWTSTGSGSGSATVGNAQAVTITAGVTPTTALYPGTTGDVTVHITNPNLFSVHIGTLAIDPSQPTNGFSASPAGCNFTGTPALSFTAQTSGGLGWTVPKHTTSDGVLDLDLTGSIQMNTNAVNACQGATFTVFLVATP